MDTDKPVSVMVWGCNHECNHQGDTFSHQVHGYFSSIMSDITLDDLHQSGFTDAEILTDVPAVSRTVSQQLCVMKRRIR